MVFKLIFSSVESNYDVTAPSRRPQNWKRTQNVLFAFVVLFCFQSSAVQPSYETIKPEHDLKLEGAVKQQSQDEKM